MLKSFLGPKIESFRSDRKVKSRKLSREEKKYSNILKQFDEEARNTIIKVKEYTMLNPEKLFAFIEAIRYVCRHGIAGDIVECGVWRGGAIMAAALTCERMGDRDRTFFLYDTFSGMTAPSERDRSVGKTDDPSELFKRQQTGPDSSNWCYASLDDVRRNLLSLAYDQSRFKLVQGKVESTIPGTMPENIAILRLDTDWYASTRHEMEHLMPRLVSGGVLIVDDYYRWSGNQEAVDEYLERHRLPILLTKVGRSVIGVRP